MSVVFVTQSVAHGSGSWHRLTQRPREFDFGQREGETLQRSHPVVGWLLCELCIPGGVQREPGRPLEELP